MSDTITLSHTDDVHSFYDYHVVIPDGLELSGEGVCVFTNYDNTSIIIPKEVFRDFVAHCQRMLFAMGFPQMTQGDLFECPFFSSACYDNGDKNDIREWRNIDAAILHAKFVLNHSPKVIWVDVCMRTENGPRIITRYTR